MKKLITLIALAFCLNAKAQTCQGPPILYEDFNSGIPSSWTIFNYDPCVLYFNMPVKGYTGAWQDYEHYGRLCAANADRYASACTANDYLITPHITLGNAPVCLSWWGSSMYSTYYTENYEVLISTTTPDSIGLKANPPLAVVTNEMPAWTAHSIDLSAYVGQTVYIAFWNNNNTDNGYAIFIDDIRVSQPVSLDVSVTSANFPDVILPSTQIVSGQMLNGGLDSITSFNLNWMVNGGTINTMSVSSVNIAPSSYYNFTHNINWAPTGNGTYTMKIWATNLNGVNDMYPADDTLTQVIFVNTFPRKSLVEEFTQASCPPCGANNPAFDAVVEPNITSGAISSIKYHTVWPGVDPMNVYDSADIFQRVLYYGIGSVPTGLVDGVFIPNSCNNYVGAIECFTQQSIDSAILVPSIFDINITEATTSTVYNATVTLTAKTDIPFNSFSLYNVIMEDTVIYSTEPGTNGETVFYQVARKMLPNSTGYQLSPMSNNQTITYTYSYTPNLSICNMNELHMVSFVSNDDTRHVYQSANTSLGVTNGIQNITHYYGINIYPNPNNGSFVIELNPSLTLPQGKGTLMQVYDVNGKLVLSQTINGKTTIDASSLNEGVYNMSLQSNEGVVNKRLVIVR